KVVVKVFFKILSFSNAKCKTVIIPRRGNLINRWKMALPLNKTSRLEYLIKCEISFACKFNQIQFNQTSMRR
ncbi:MAG: hypothetical protein ACTS6G_06420, partial [Candidatus Hodgkinia cicadicola]